MDVAILDAFASRRERNPLNINNKENNEMWNERNKSIARWFGLACFCFAVSYEHIKFGKLSFVYLLGVAALTLSIVSSHRKRWKNDA
jgi:hypothetical protein